MGQTAKVPFHTFIDTESNDRWNPFPIRGEQIRINLGLALIYG